MNHNLELEKIKIGIDPDVSRSGVAVYFQKTKKLELKNLSFFELMDFLKVQSSKFNLTEVVIEAGYLNKSNWHTTAKGNKYNAQIGQRTGANHEVAKKIIEMCDYLQLPHRAVRPRLSKLNAQIFKLMTKHDHRTNQEQRDAAMLVYG